LSPLLQAWLRIGDSARRDRHSRSLHRQTVGANDPYFLEVNHELSDQGFFVPQPMT